MPIIRTSQWSTLLFLMAASAYAADTHSVDLNGQTFTLPAGFEIERVAAPPLVDRPVTGAFDEAGRLYVADSSGSNDKVGQQLAEKPHRILRLADTNGDGVFDEQTVFADRMMFPAGTLWHAGSLYVAAPPSIWKLTDTDGDGVADQREEWFQGKTLTGCANDLHGPYLGRDGLIYWCKGAFAEQTYERPGRSPFVTRAAHIFRCRPDAPRDPATGSIASSAIEPVMTGGMDNPVDVAFTSSGERIFTTTFLVNPGGGQRDGLIHAIYGGVYGKIHGVLDGHPRTGDVMPVLVHLGAAAPCGLTCYESGRFGDDYRGNLFACCFNMHKLTRHVLQDNGAALSATTEDFLTSSNIDFHPTDVIEDADGSLLVIDTGGWYKLCCPTSTLWKPDVLGGIYRIRRTDPDRAETVWDDPRGLKLSWNDEKPAAWAALLGDPRPAVRDRAMQLLASEGAAAVEVVAQQLHESRSEAARVAAVWTLTRIDRPEAREAVRSTLHDAAPTVRLAALNSISLWRDRDALPELRRLVLTESPEGRLAAEALGRIGGPVALSDLLTSANGATTREMQHAVTYALWEIGDAAGLEEALQSPSLKSQAAAAMALDQLDSSAVHSDQAIAWLKSDSVEARETARWLMARHSEWGAALADDFRQRLKQIRSEAEASALLGDLLLFTQSPEIQQLVGSTLADASQPRASRLLAAEAMRLSNVRQLPDSWKEGLTTAIAGDDHELTARAIAAARSLAPPETDAEEFNSALRKAAGNTELAVDQRLDALAALAGGAGALDDDTFQFLTSHLTPEDAVHDRAAAIRVLHDAALSTRQLITLAAAFNAIGPLEAPRLLEVFSQSSTDDVGHALVSALETSPALMSLRVDALTQTLSKYGPDVQSHIEPLASRINVNLAQQRQQLEAMLARVSEGDVRRGLAVFHSAKAGCASCHQMGYVGGNIGPDLSKIGQVRAERDLLEAIMFPSASFVRSYEPVMLQLTDGRVESGLLKEETGGELVLIKSATETLRIPQQEIEVLRPGTTSVMPAGFGQQLSSQDLADLTVFLKSLQ